METLASLFVGKPLNILGVGALFFVLWFTSERTGATQLARPRSLLVVAAAWALYAAWEWLVLVRTPEADIRVDLLVIWPLLLLLTIGFTIRAFLPIRG